MATSGLHGHIPKGSLCSMPKSEDVLAERELCCQELDPRGLHLYSCKAGTAVLRPHRSLTLCLGNILKDAGAHTDIVRACPELYQVT